MSGDEIFHKAEKTANKFFFSKNSKNETVGTLYSEAGSEYMKIFNWTKAANAFKLSGEYFSKSGDTFKYEMQDAFEKAYKCNNNAFEKEGMPLDDYCDFVENYMIPIKENNGEMANIGKLYYDLAQKTEQFGDMDKTIEYYKEALKYYECDDTFKSQKFTIMEKLALLISQHKNDFDTAIYYFETVAEGKINNNLLKFGAKKLLLNALLCALAKNDVVLANKKLEEYLELDYTFIDSTDHKFFLEIYKTINDLDFDAYTDVVSKKNQTSLLDNWQVFVLSKIKTNIKNESKIDLT